MNPAEFREKFKAFLADNSRYRKFIAIINRSGAQRILFWQERALEEFCKENQIAPPNLASLKEIFAICEIHEIPLTPGKVKVFSGHIDYSNDYTTALLEKFPNSYLSEVNGPKELHGKFVDINFCPSCRDAELAWKQM